jgi:cadmium resistance protein CadD (predicted permease)
MNQGYQVVLIGRFIFLMEYLVEVTGTLASISPLYHTIEKY